MEMRTLRWRHGNMETYTCRPKNMEKWEIDMETCVYGVMET
jgi:hypothetical protein